MAPTPLEVLKKGFTTLKSHVNKRKKALEDRLRRNERIDDADAEWLDDQANLVDEQRALQDLENASDYERGVSRLSSAGEAAVRRMTEFAQGIKTSVPAIKVIGAKRKKPDHKPVIPVGKTPGKKKETAPVFTRAEHATLAQKIEILDWYHANGQKQGATAKHWAPIYPNLRLKQPKISDWVRNEAKIRLEFSQSVSKAVKRMRQTQHPQVTEMLELWVEQAMRDKIQLNGEVLRQKWKQFADLCGVPEDERLALSTGWLERTKHRLGLREFKRHGEAASADPIAVEMERERVKKLIEKGGYKARDVYNMDETGLFYGFAPDRGLSNEKSSGVKGSKVRLTYAFAVNADGSHKLEPFVIGKAKQPRSFDRRTAAALGFYYRNNAKAWMTTVLYREWITKWDAELRLANRRVLLLQDNFSAHNPPDDLTNITVVNFTANLTAHVQPLDGGIIRCFKAHYRSRFTQRAIDNYDRGITPADIYNINQLEGMRIAAAAWREVDASTIRHCWRHVGILPESVFSNSQPATIPVASLLSSPAECLSQAAEQDLERRLDALEDRGVLQRVNRMSLAQLLNPENEDSTEQATVEDIYAAVSAARLAQENSDAAGGDDDQDDDADLVVRPSRREALAAVSTLQRFTATLNDDFSRKLDAVLARFGHQTQLEETNQMKTVPITTFFQKT
ncbi:DDE-domain-containing protein [Mycena venus]|uniref:DDE-domain-containing protein n=1 Tax=Mycena venus TaxID=2733690 RepID=A0A8H7CTM5_9AGAR|nr:DDE-domain-containing protein [Mycena venus]